MCDPFSIVAGGLAIAGAHNQAEAQQDADQANAEVARMNKALFDFYADDAIKRGKQEIDRYKMSIKQLKGRQRAMAGFSNVEMSGSQAQVLADTARIAKLDMLKIENNAAREAYGYKLQGKGASASARMATAGSDQRYLGTMLTGGAQALGIYQNSQRAA